MNNNLPNKISCPNKGVATEVVDCSKIDLPSTTSIVGLNSLCDIILAKYIHTEVTCDKKPQKCKPKVMRSIWEDVCVIKGLIDDSEINCLYSIYDNYVLQCYNRADLLKALEDSGFDFELELVFDIIEGLEKLCLHKKTYSHNQWKRYALNILKVNPNLLDNISIDLKEIVRNYSEFSNKLDRELVRLISNYLDNKVEEMKLIKYKKICDINTNGSSILNIVDSRNVVRELHTISTNGDSPLVLEYIDYSSLFELLENGSTLNEHRNLNFVEGSLSEFLIGDMILQLNFNRREHNLEEVVRSF